MMRRAANRWYGVWKARVVACTVMALAALLVCASLTSCSGVGPGSGTWTICLYLCGSNLESRQSWASKTLKEIREAGVPENVTLVIQTGGAKRWHSDDVANGTRFVAHGHELEAVGDVGDVNMGEGSTLTDFLTFCAEEYPSEHAMAVLWDHGGGPLKGACFDEKNDFDALELPELDEAFAAGVAARGGKPYDLVGFDACLMGSLETAITMSDDASWLVASEELEAGPGWSYVELLHSLGLGADARAAGIAICEGYKVKSARHKKDATATLSVIDLSKVRAVEDALDELIDALRAEYGGTKVVRRVAYGVRNAESFGGASHKEGHTNLTDLIGITKGMLSQPSYQKQQEGLAAAIEEAVVFSVCGDATTGANGLSMWYPISSSASEVANYAKVSPLEKYAQLLASFFAEDPVPLKFLDEVKMDKDGGVTMTVDPACADAFFDLYVENRRTDGTYADTNVDIADDWDNLSFTYTPALAVAITLDGMVLDANVVGYGLGYDTFSSPIEVDGKRTNLRTTWVENEEEEDGGHYELLGTWGGIDDLNGLADRSMADLAPGSTVSAVSLESEELREGIVVGKQPKVSETPLAPGSYEFRFVAIDLMGNEYPSQEVAYKVAEDGTTTIVSVGGVPTS